MICWASSFLVGMIALALSSLVVLSLHRIQPIGLLWIVFGRNQYLDYVQSRFLKMVAMGGNGHFLLMGIALSKHMLPGFNNLIIFDKFNFQPILRLSLMYLNFDQTVVGSSFIFFFSRNVKRCRGRRKTASYDQDFRDFTLFMLPVVLATHYVRIDPKLPPQPGSGL